MGEEIFFYCFLNLFYKVLIEASLQKVRKYVYYFSLFFVFAFGLCVMWWCNKPIFVFVYPMHLNCLSIWESLITCRIKIFSSFYRILALNLVSKRKRKKQIFSRGEKFDKLFIIYIWRRLLPCWSYSFIFPEIFI